MYLSIKGSPSVMSGNNMSETTPKRVRVVSRREATDVEGMYMRSQTMTDLDGALEDSLG
jgi:hypothetical protein